ncbi:helix-turn-helix transcriptional regulator [Deinococcus sp.]|uniref:response regulator transcription factor n=1 Tax=Deinococcus sp. TaxID=47478 RepID=UPI0025D5198F|nr:helix-turn-helix transcriptional regulator [Deinococcus sp.]
MATNSSQLQVVGDQLLVAHLLEEALRQRVPDCSSMQLILDIPFGFAARTVTPEMAWKCFILTENACAEYLDDLWNMNIVGLACNIHTLTALVELLCQASSGERVRFTPTERSPLTKGEAELFRLVARGLSNKEIARQLDLALPTVQNGLTRVFQKLGVEGRGEAILIYWGVAREE